MHAYVGRRHKHAWRKIVLFECFPQLVSLIKSTMCKVQNKTGTLAITRVFALDRMQKLTSLKNFPHLAANKLVADQGTTNQEMSAPANGSCAIRTAISQYLINLCFPSECTAAEFWKQAKYSNTYSVLSLFAQDLLSAPASQAFTERLFSVLCL